MINFVSTLDYSNKQMKFAVNANAPDGVTSDFPDPVVEDDSGLSGGAIFGIIAACIIGLIIIVAIINCFV